MATRQQSIATSPASSSTSLPLLLSSRRDSLASAASKPHIDRAAVSKALDSIHSSASRTTTLTNFNDFVTPPPSTLRVEQKGPASHLVQNGLGGIYNRLKATVGVVSEISDGTSHARSSAQNRSALSREAEDAASQYIQNAKVEPSLSKLSSRSGIDSINSTGTTAELLTSRGVPKTSVPSAQLANAQNTAEPRAPAHLSAADHGKSHIFINEKLTYSNTNRMLDLQKSDLQAEQHERLVPQNVSEGSGPTSTTPVSTIGPNQPERVSGRAVAVSQDLETLQGGLVSGRDQPISSNVKSLHFGSQAHNITEFGVLRKGTPEITTPVVSQVLESRRGGSDARSVMAATLNKAMNPKPESPTSDLISQMRKKVISRDFWMKDENAKVCFGCGDNFSLVKRKHHCRLCGQIYDSKCTKLIPGKLFGQPGRLRVCRACEALISGEDDSSNYSEEDSSLPTPHVKQMRFPDAHSAASPTSGNRSKDSLLELPPLSASTTVSRAGQMHGRRRSVSSIAFDVHPALARPSSSRSLKSLSTKTDYKQRKLRHQRALNQGLTYEFGAPFYEDTIQQPRSQAMGESIIDPDLVPFLSDDGSSDGESVSIAASMYNDPSSSAVTRKSRVRTPKKNGLDLNDIARDVNGANLPNSKAGRLRRHTRFRSMSVGSLLGLSRWTSRQEIVPFSGWSSGGSAGFVNVGKMHLQPQHNLKNVAQAATAQPTPVHIAELNHASLNHAKRMLRQFLRDARIDHEERWVKALIPILLRCAEDIDPNNQRGDAIDVRHYVKLKKALGGKPTDTIYVAGVVFRKNIARKSMPRAVQKPRILLLSFSVAYIRRETHFMSIDQILLQEREYLSKLVDRILALRPTVVLVQKNVSGLAMEFLEEANVAVIHNVKQSVLRAVARCTQTRIISSAEKLAIEPEDLGICQSFEVKTFIHKKTKTSYIFFSGCQHDLGCTITLRGSNLENLSKLKPITEFMCYVVYNLKLENCLLRDMFISLPSFACNEMDNRHKPPADVSVSGHTLGNVATSDRATNGYDIDECNVMIQELDRRVLSSSPFVEFAKPYLLVRGSEQEQKMRRLRRLQEQYDATVGYMREESSSQPFELVKPEKVFEEAANTTLQVREVLCAMHDAEYDNASHYYAFLKRRWEAYHAGAIDPFSPLTHQKIVVLYSIVSTANGNACEGPDLLGFDFYQERDVDDTLEPDLPLGEFVELLCQQTSMSCTAGQCDKRMIDHHRQYVHGEGQVTIRVQKHPPKLRGMENTILMWSCCRICNQETQVAPMSTSSWKYSFGKYLELCFWSSPLHPRAALCSHDVHKDHNRFFGFKELAIRVQYNPINVVELIVPRGTITWKVGRSLSLKNSEYQKIDDKIGRFMSSVKRRLKSINLQSISADRLEACQAEIKSLLQRLDDDQQMLVKVLQERYTQARYYEVIPMNQAVKSFQKLVADWDDTFADFEHNYLLSDVDIRKLATVQLKDAYFDTEEHDATVLSVDTGVEADLDRETSVVSGSEKTRSAADVQVAHDPPTLPAQGLSTSLKDTKGSERVESIDLITSGTALEVHEISSDISTTPSLSNNRTVEPLNLAVSSETIKNLTATNVNPTGHNLFGSAPSELHMNERKIVSNADSSSSHLMSPPVIQIEQKRRAPLDGDKTPGTRATRTVKPALPSTPRTLEAVPAQFHARTQSPVSIRSAADKPRPAESSNGLPGEASMASRAAQVAFKRASGLQSPGIDVTPSEQAGRVQLQGEQNTSPSMVPKYVRANVHDSRVSTLAKHFEQMSRVFEQERLRERRQRAARNRRARKLPRASSQSVVEIFRDAHEAVMEPEPFEQETQRNALLENLTNTSQELATYAGKDSIPTDVSPTSAIELQVGTTSECGEDHTENDMKITNSTGEMGVTGSKEVLSNQEAIDDTDQHVCVGADSDTDVCNDIPKAEKSTLMRMLTSFWSERSASGWAPLEYPLVASAHIFEDSDIIVRDDEPSSLIAFALASVDYQRKLTKIRDTGNVNDAEQQQPCPEPDDMEDANIERVLLGKTATHMRYQFEDGTARMQCKVFYAESFDAIRRKCGVAERFVESLSRCLKWDSKGGKTKSLFLKTLDGRFVLKSLSAVETQAFLRFAPDYFDYMSKVLFRGLPSVLAKMLGFYQVVIKNPVSGTELNYFLQVMENIFYEGPTDRMFDLKGSMRNRKIKSTGEQNEVLLDENLLEHVSRSPIYIRNHSSSILGSSISNDTLFCLKQNVMDYSLIVGLYEAKKELLVGIIDYIRTYTWDKKLESWIKDRGRHKPTVMVPKDYRNRFKVSIPRYFPLAPSCWQNFGMQRVEQQGTWSSVEHAADVEEAETVSRDTPSEEGVE